MRTILPIILLVACGETAFEGNDLQLIAESVPKLDIQQVFELISLELPVVGNCPEYIIGDNLALVSGDCIEDGLQIRGSVELSQTWIAMNDLQVYEEGDLTMALNGAIETTVQDELLVVYASLTGCGWSVHSCEDGVVTLDLTYTIYPVTSFPDFYDITVEGVIAGEDPLEVYGAWKVDRHKCISEPVSGSLAFETDRTYSFDFDGETICDSCAIVAIEGVPEIEACGWLP